MHEKHCAHQQQRQSFGVFHCFLAEKFHPHTSAGIGLGMIGGDARCNRLQLRPHLLDRDSALHLGEALEIKIATRILLLLDLQRHPQIGRLRKTPAFRHHPDNGDALAVYRDDAANDVGI